ncbi:type II and III secretion system protein family protein [Pseudidiomarina aestuarii]|uniref:type II and III secretion system protein family protein n=1 Tax=Pseudidiomarina aestuarii TaxID=624146 RepID=UPI003A975F2B
MISPTRILIIYILISVTAVSFKVSAEIPSNPEAQAKNYEIEIGQTFLIHVEEGSDVVVGSEQLLQAQLIQNNQLVISGLAPGHSEILLLAPNRSPQTIRVHIQAPINRRLHADLEQLQANFPELIVEHDGDVILLRGDLDSAAQEHFDHLEQDYPEVMNRIRWRQAQQVPMIELAVQIAEVKRQYTRQLGVRWPQQVSGPLVSSEAAQIISMPVDIQAAIDLLEREGHARLLAEPLLSARSGGSAEFLVGGEFPIPQVLAQGQQDVTFREYGVALSMAPELLSDGSIKTLVGAEISSIDPATTVNGIPGILSRKVSSVIAGRSGEAIVLSGLISHEQSLQTDQFPGLHRVPLLGRLFLSEQFRSAATELIVIVTPHVRDDSQIDQTAAKRAQRQREFYQTAGCTGLREIHHAQ